jgi:hypothetical protein
MATNRNSTLYANVHVNKYLTDARDLRGRAVPLPFEHTVVSGETGGASAGVQDTVNLCVIPAGSKVVALDFVSNAVWASAGVNGTLEIGDSGDTDRYMAATELYSTNSPIATMGDLRCGQLAFAGQGYEPTAATIVYATYKVANPTVGKIFKGVIWVIPGV